MSKIIAYKFKYTPKLSTITFNCSRIKIIILSYYAFDMIINQLLPIVIYTVETFYTRL